MAGTKRERQLARDRYLRQQQRRAESAAKRRRRQQILSAIVAAALVLGGLAFAVSQFRDDSDSVATAEPAASSEPTPSEPAQPTPSDPAAPSSTPTDLPASGNVTCTYTPAGEAAKEAGTPPAEGPAAKPYVATLRTNQGTVKFESAEQAPCTSRSFAHLASKNYFNDTSCHRLTTSGLFVLQCGDPTGQGSGGPGYGFGIENAPPDGNYPAGTVAMARTNDPNSNGSQFFLVYDDTQLPTEGGGYTIFGRITEGLDVLKKIAAAGAEPDGDGAPKQAVRLESVTTGAS